MPFTDSDRAGTFAPHNAQTGQPLKLDMQQLQLTGELAPYGARLVASHIFRHEEPDPIEVIYSFSLPRDATLSRFVVKGDGFSIESRLEPKKKAEEQYEQGLKEGNLSTLATIHQDGMVNLALGNIRPHETVVVQLELLAGVEARDTEYRLRFPFCLDPGYHAQARPWVDPQTGVASIGLPFDKFGDVKLPKWVADAKGLHTVSFALDVLEAGCSVSSPTHPLNVAQQAKQLSVSLATTGSLPNRDLVLQVARADSRQPAVWAAADDKKHGQFAAVLPSTLFGSAQGAPRTMVFVLDHSGSMEGIIDKARAAATACLAALSEHDSFGIVLFQSQVQYYSSRLMKATADNRRMAKEWLEAKYHAGGGTETALGIQQAANIAKESGAKELDVFLLTDGEVHGQDAILKTARDSQMRIHVFGIGISGRERFLSQLADATGGISRYVAAGEQVDLQAIDMFAGIGHPVASGLSVQVDGGAWVAPEPPANVFSGQPVVLFGQCSAKGCKMRVEWDGCKQPLVVPIGLKQPKERAAAIGMMRGARLISLAESGTSDAQELDRKLVKLAEDYGLATRTHALVAVLQREGDRAGLTPESRVVAVGMPGDTPFAAYFGQTGFQGPCGVQGAQGAQGTQGYVGRTVHTSGLMRSAAPPSSSQMCFSVGGARGMSLFNDENIVDCCSLAPNGGGLEMEFGDVLRSTSATYTGGGSPGDISSLCIQLVSQLDGDGGMPGGDRVLASVAALCCLLTAGSSLQQGAFRMHIARIVGWLRTVDKRHAHAKLVAKALAMAEGQPQAHGAQGWPTDDVLKLGSGLLACRPPEQQAVEALLGV